MSDQPELVTVFRSAEPSAEEEAEEIHGLLREAGLLAVLCGDDTPGVPQGACEVRVPAEQAERADQVIAAAQEAAEPGDPSHQMDLETIFDALGATAEMEAIGVRSVLEANGIPSVFVGTQVYPNLRFLVRVPKKHAAQARQVLAEAQAVGPSAAEEAEQSSE